MSFPSSVAPNATRNEPSIHSLAFGIQTSNQTNLHAASIQTPHAVHRCPRLIHRRYDPTHSPMLMCSCAHVICPPQQSKCCLSLPHHTQTSLHTCIFVDSWESLHGPGSQKQRSAFQPSQKHLRRPSGLDTRHDFLHGIIPLHPKASENN